MKTTLVHTMVVCSLLLLLACFMAFKAYWYGQQSGKFYWSFMILWNIYWMHKTYKLYRKHSN